MDIALRHADKAVLLLANDDDPRVAAIKHHLHNYCQRLIFTKQTSDIVRLISQYRFELILLDLHLNGILLIKKINKKQSITSATPCIALINKSDEEQKKHVIAAGFDDCLTKSLDLKPLAELLDVWQITRSNSKAATYITSMLSKTYGDQKLALSIFQKLLTELPEQVATIKDALETHEYELARQVAHKLNGSVSLCGFIDLQQTAQSLESSLLNHDYSRTHKKFLVLQQSILNFTSHSEAVVAYFGQ